MRFVHAAPLALIVGGMAFAAVACGSASKRGTFDEAAQDDPNAGSPPLTNGQTPCKGLECKRVACDDPTITTTLTGKVYDPAGANPLYNVMVYIPAGPNGDAELPPIPEGVQCDTCGSTALNPMVSAITNEKGEFTLENVPVDSDVPVVVQVGKWRRKLKFDITKKCDENRVPDREFRLPKNGTEGDMPHIAVTAGGCDALECLLRGIGVDDSEFVEATTRRATSTCSRAPAARASPARRQRAARRAIRSAATSGTTRPRCSRTTWSCSPASAARTTTTRAATSAVRALARR